MHRLNAILYTSSRLSASCRPIYYYMVHSGIQSHNTGVIFNVATRFETRAECSKACRHDNQRTYNEDIQRGKFTGNVTCNFKYINKVYRVITSIVGHNHCQRHSLIDMFRVSSTV